jgi:hypothetical protein
MDGALIQTEMEESWIPGIAIMYSRLGFGRADAGGQYRRAQAMQAD